MAPFNLAPQRQHPARRGEDYSVSGCLVWSRYSDFKKGGVPAILDHFTLFCRSEGFIRHCASLGFTSPAFYPNAGNRNSTLTGNESARTSLAVSNAGYKKFAKCFTVSDNKSDNVISDDSYLGLVFHGTAQANIDSILQTGLSKARRTKQVYGPGEYFSKEPTVSISYCKGGLEMVVFVVVLPARVGKKYENCPADYVAVENNHHHLALGVLKFQAVDNRVVQVSQQRRQKFRDLNNRVFARGQIKLEAAMKAKIIQHLIAGEAHVAAEFYEKKPEVLHNLSKREISWYVHQNLDDKIIEWLFPGIPDPMDINEINAKTVQNLDDADMAERKAKRELEEAQKDFYGKVPTECFPFATANDPLAWTVNSVYTTNTVPVKNQKAAAHTSMILSSLSETTTKPASLPESVVLDTPTQICKHLFANRVDMASELYSKKAASLDLTSKKEIYDIAFRCVDPSLLNILFPGLPQSTLSTVSPPSTSC